MRNNRKLRVFIALMAVLIIMPMLTTTAYANADEGDEADTDLSELEIDLSELLIALNDPVPIPEPTPPPEPVPLTPPGNMNLVDDVSGEQSEDKQFITVVTKSGEYFYIVIDRASDRENVHFLSLVDEAELLAIIEESAPQPAPQATPQTPVQTAPITQPEPEPEPEPEKSSTGSLIILIVLLGAIGGGAYYYFKVLKPKMAKKGGNTTNLDEFNFDEDEDDFDGGNSEYISAGGLEEPEYGEHEQLPTTDIEVPAEENSEVYTYEPYVSDVDRPEGEGEE